MKKRREQPPYVAEEARKLLALFKNQPLPKLSQEAFGARYDLGTQGNVWQYLHGRQPLNLEAALAFARGLHCQVADFSPRLARALTEPQTTNGPPRTLAEPVTPYAAEAAPCPTSREWLRRLAKRIADRQNSEKLSADEAKTLHDIVVAYLTRAA